MKCICIDIINITAMRFYYCAVHITHEKGNDKKNDVCILYEKRKNENLFNFDVVFVAAYMQVFSFAHNKYMIFYIIYNIYYYNLNFSFHFGHNVCGFIDVARINFAGTGPPNESRCSRRLPSFRLKLNRKL